MDYEYKYLKYKKKYLELCKIKNEKQVGGDNYLNSPPFNKVPYTVIGCCGAYSSVAGTGHQKAS